MTSGSVGGARRRGFSKKVSRSTAQLMSALTSKTRPGRRSQNWRNGETPNGLAQLPSPAAGSRGPPVNRTLLPPSGNNNQPQDYLWLQDLLQDLASNNAHSLGCVDTATNKPFTPIFVLVGVAPSTFAPMQAPMYCTSSSGEVDFWFVKPQKKNSGELEKATLNRNNKGQWKNDPGGSKKFLKPLAEMFQGSKGSHYSVKDHNVGIDLQSQPPRAFLNKPGKERMWLTFIWMEDWSANPFAKKYLKGKIIYQRHPTEMRFFSAQYTIMDKVMEVMDYEDEPWTTILPPETVKNLFE